MRPAELNSKVVEIAGDFEGAEACLALLETRFAPSSVFSAKFRDQTTCSSRRLG